jgi:hypothetical protein
MPENPSKVYVFQKVGYDIEVPETRYFSSLTKLMGFVKENCKEYELFIGMEYKQVPVNDETIAKLSRHLRQEEFGTLYHLTSGDEINLFIKTLE